jgi:single-stranded-DNA-specific exonuclease
LDWILDWRGQELQVESLKVEGLEDNLQPSTLLKIHECPTSWDELQVWFRRAIQADRKLAIAYSPPLQLPPREIWQQLVGIAKFLSRTGQSATLTQLQDKLDLSDRTLHLGLKTLSHLGFQIRHLDWSLTISWPSTHASSEAIDPVTNDAIQDFLAAVEEEQFLRQYFYQVPLSTIQKMARAICYQ